MLQAQTITVVTGEYSPWSDSKAKYKGFVNRVIFEAFKQEGYDVKFTFKPWKATEKLAKRGKYDASSFWYKSKEREKVFLYSNTINEEKTVFFKLKSTGIKYNKLSDLKGYKIGATLGYTYTKEFWDMKKNKTLNIKSVKSDTLNFKKLLKGKIDIFPCGLTTGYQILNKSFSKNIIHTVGVASLPLTKVTGHLIFPKVNKKSKKYLKIFNIGLKKLHQKGLYSKYEDELLTGIY